MLVFISDLHITDKTTGVQHLSVAAFNEALANLARQAHEAKSQEITFVFLGDIFDLVRTTFWSLKPLGERPWGLPERPSAEQLAVLEGHALELLRETLDENRDIFDLWSGPLKDKFGLPVEPRRVYIPGNHDRICNQFTSLRRIIIECLRLNEGLAVPLKPEEGFGFHYFAEDYAVFARHGHEWDAYNFEHTAAWANEKYILPPAEHYLELSIGEVVAAELASRLPFEVEKRLPAVIPAADRALIVEHMKTIDDVRPTLAFLPWLVSSLEAQPALRRHRRRALKAITEAIQKVVTDLDALDFTRRWMAKHDSIAPFDYVDQLQLMFLALKKLNVAQIESVLKQLASRPALAASAIARMIPAVNEAMTEDNYATQALADLERIQKDERFKDKVLYMLYGHTHQADQVPIAVHANLICQVYLNTGTWRPLYRQTAAGRGFMRWKNMTFTIFYSAEADPGNLKEGTAPTFETWTGALLDPM